MSPRMNKNLELWFKINIYLVLFRISFENENQSCSTTWWW
jgi:hypothetical protein